MFPTSGFFRSYNCPYYLSGLCERPYCHFRHVKQEERPPAVRLPSSTARHQTRRVSESGQSRVAPSTTSAAAPSGPAPSRQASSPEGLSSNAGGCGYTPTPLSVLRRTKERPATATNAVAPADGSYEPMPVAAGRASSATASVASPATDTVSPSPPPNPRRRPLQLPAPKSCGGSGDSAASGTTAPDDIYDPMDGAEVDVEAAWPSKRGRRDASPQLAHEAPTVAVYEPTPIDSGGYGGASYGDDGSDNDDDQYCPVAAAAQPASSLQRAPPSPPLPPPAVTAVAAAPSDAATTPETTETPNAEGSGIQQVFLDLFGEEPAAAASSTSSSSTASPSKLTPTTATIRPTISAASAPIRVPAASSSAGSRLSLSEQVARRAQQAAANPSGLLGQGKVRAAVSSTPAPAAATPLPGTVANKIPELIRQRYLDRLSEECRLAGEPADRAAGRAQQLELECYERSANRNVYLNAVILAIKRVRATAGQAQQTPEQKRKQTAENAGQMSDKRLHRHLMQYALTTAQLAEQKFPPHLPALPYPAPSNPLERLCVRCGAAFLLQQPQMSVPPGQCCYHYGRAYSRRVPGAGIQQIYTCCGGDVQAKGCSVGVRHVHEYNVYCDRDGYKQTVEPDKETVRKKQRLSVFALDCEMVYTDAGKELARVTMIDRSLAVVYDRLVRPGAPIVDCNTRFSGLREEQLEGAGHRLADVQEELMKLVYSSCILIGHSLESDLQVLKLRHQTVVDTSIVFPHRMGLPKKRALRNLASEILDKVIQAGGDAGHDSSEDARACMELMLNKVTEDLKKGKGLG